MCSELLTWLCICQLPEFLTIYKIWNYDKGIKNKNCQHRHQRELPLPFRPVPLLCSSFCRLWSGNYSKSQLGRLPGFVDIHSLGWVLSPVGSQRWLVISKLSFYRNSVLFWSIRNNTFELLAPLWIHVILFHFHERNRNLAPAGCLRSDIQV